MYGFTFDTKKMSKLVSIVLPVYNGEKYLRESIDSVLAQTYQNWELLVIDDCSSDHTAEIVASYLNHDKRIKYYKNEYNLRLPKNLNKGFSYAIGDYLTWTSDDNRYLPTAIQRMVEELDKDNDIQFVFASCRIIDEKGKEIEFFTVNSNSPKLIVGINSVGACFLYTRKVYKAIGDYDSNYELVEDFDYWQRVYSRFKMMGISEILYQYRIHSGALTSTMKTELFNENLEIMLIKNRPLFEKINIEQKYYYFYALSNSREKRNLPNKYKKRKDYYRVLFFLFYRIPRKIKNIY